MPPVRRIEKKRIYLDGQTVVCPVTSLVVMALFSHRGQVLPSLECIIFLRNFSRTGDVGRWRHFCVVVYGLRVFFFLVLFWFVQIVRIYVCIYVRCVRGAPGVGDVTRCMVQGFVSTLHNIWIMRYFWTRDRRPNRTPTSVVFIKTHRLRHIEGGWSFIHLFPAAPMKEYCRCVSCLD